MISCEKGVDYVTGSFGSLIAIGNGPIISGRKQEKEADYGMGSGFYVWKKRSRGKSRCRRREKYMYLRIRDSLELIHYVPFIT
jgi:hypothetical protein